MWTNDGTKRPLGRPEPIRRVNKRPASILFSLGVGGRQTLPTASVTSVVARPIQAVLHRVYSQQLAAETEGRKSHRWHVSDVVISGPASVFLFTLSVDERRETLKAFDVAVDLHVRSCYKSKNDHLQLSYSSRITERTADN